MKHEALLTFHAALKAAFMEGFGAGANVTIDAIHDRKAPDLLDECEKAWEKSGTKAAQEEK